MFDFDTNMRKYAFSHPSMLFALLATFNILFFFFHFSFLHFFQFSSVLITFASVSEF